MGAQQVDEEAIFDVARRIDSLEARSDYLQQVCGDDVAMLARVRALLKVHDEQPEFLEAAPSRILKSVDSMTPVESSGTVIGLYKLREQIGEGGFGVVYVAEQDTPVRRKVALKLIKPGMDTKDVVARFEAERQALALMDHPNVARVLDAGATESGRPYFVMELVHGVPITEFCDKNILPVRQRLELVMDICHAVQHAHHKGIIHRDLKPNNIMVTLHDGRPVPKVIDFGVSKALSQQLTEKTIYTSYGQMIGTPVYMSPEQAEMSGLGVDTRSDVYSLGALLYELLTGRTPLDAERLRTSAYAEMLRMIREEEPPRPSAKISTLGETATVIAQHRRTDPRKLRQSLCGELDWIVMKALDKDRNRRYDTANSFAADIERFLAGEAVHACPPSTVYLLRKFARRHRGPVIAVGALLLVLCLGLAGTSLGLIWAKRESQRARSAETEASIERDSAHRARQEAVDAARRARQAELEAREEAEQKRLQLYVSDTNSAHAAIRAGDIEWALHLLRRHQPEDGKDDLRCFEWFYLWRRCHQNLAASPLYHPGRIAANDGVAFSPDGKSVATGCSDGSVRIWDIGTDDPKILPFQDSGAWTQTISVQFSPDGATLAALGRTYGAALPGPLILYDLKTDDRHDLEHEYLSCAFVDKDILLTAKDDGTLHGWNVHTGEQQDDRSLDLAGEQWSQVAFSPNCKMIAAKDSNAPTVTLWDVETRTKMGRPMDLGWDQARTWQLRFSPDGRILAEISSERGGPPAWDGIGRLNLWDVSNQELHVPPIHEPVRGYRSMAFLPDGVVATGGVGDIKFWELATGEAMQRMESTIAHTGIVFCLSTSPDCRVIASAGYDRYVRLWNVQQEQNPHVVKADESDGKIAYRIAYSPAGDYLASYGDGEVKLWNPHTGIALDTLHKFPEGRLGRVAFSPDGELLAAASDSRSTIRLWNVRSRELINTIKAPHQIGNLAFSPDGKRIVCGSDQTINIWEVHSARPLDGVPTRGETPVAFSPVANVVAFMDGSIITLRYLDSGRELPLVGADTAGAYILKFSPDGRLLACKCNSGVILFDTLTGHPTLTITQNAGEGLFSMDLSPDGKSLLTASWTGAVILWDTVTGDQRFTLRDYGGPIASSAVFSPDGQTVAAAFMDGTIVFWRAGPVEP